MQNSSVYFPIAYAKEYPEENQRNAFQNPVIHTAVPPEF